MRRFYKTVLNSVSFISLLCFSQTARAAECTQTSWNSDTTACTVSATTFLLANGSSLTGDWSVPQKFNTTNHIPVGATKTINAQVYFAGGNYYLQSYSDGSALTPNILMGANGYLINTGSVGESANTGVYYITGGTTTVSGGVYSAASDGYLRILNGVPHGMLTKTEVAASDLYNKSNINISGGTFNMRAGTRGGDNNNEIPTYSVIGFLKATEWVVPSIGSSAKLYNRGGAGTLQIEGGEFNITGTGFVRLGTSAYATEQTSLKRATNIYGGVYNIASGTTLLIEGDTIVLSKNPSGSNIAKFLGAGTLQIGSDSGIDAVTISNGFTSTENGIKRVAFSGNVTLQTDEYFKELELKSGTFSFTKTVNVREKLIQQSGAAINSPDGILELEDGVTADFNGKVVLNTLTVRDDAVATLTQYQSAGTANSVTITNLRAEDAKLFLYANVATLQNLYLTGDAVLNAFEGFNLYNASFTTTTDFDGNKHIPHINLVSQKGTTPYSNSTLIVQSGTLTMDGRNLTAYTLDAADAFNGAGKGGIRLTGYANLITTGEVFGRGTSFSTDGSDVRDRYALSVQAQYGTVTVNSAKTYLDSVKVIFRDESGEEDATATTGGIIFNGAEANVKTLSIDQGGFLTVNSGVTLGIGSLIETGENSTVTGAGTLGIGAGAARFKGTFGMGNVGIAGGASATFDKNVSVTGTFGIAKGASAVFNGISSINAMTLETGTGTDAADHASVTFSAPVTLSSLTLGSYSSLILDTGSSSLGHVSYTGSNASLILQKGETIMDTGTITGGTGNSIQIMQGAILGVTKSIGLGGGVLGVPEVEIFGAGKLRLVGGANVTLGSSTGTDAEKLLYAIEIGSGTATVSGGTGTYYSLGQLTFTSPAAGSLGIDENSKLILTDNLTTGAGNAVNAANGTIQLYCDKAAEKCFNNTSYWTGHADLGGTANIGTLALSQGYLKVSGTTNLTNLTFKGASAAYVQIDAGGVLNLKNMTAGTSNKYFKGDGTLNVVSGGTVDFATLTDTLAAVNIAGTVDMTGAATVKNTVIAEGGRLNFQRGTSYRYVVPTDGTLTVNGSLGIHGGGSDGTSGLTVKGTANFNNAIDSLHVLGKDAVIIEGGTANYNYNSSAVADTQADYIKLKDGGTLNVTNDAKIVLASSASSGVNNIVNIARDKTVTLNYTERGSVTGNQTLNKTTLTGAGTITLNSPTDGYTLTLADGSKIDGLNVLKMRDGVSLELSTAETHSLNSLELKGGLLRINTGAQLNLYKGITEGSTSHVIQGAGTLRAMNGADFTFSTGIGNLGALFVENGAVTTVGANAGDNIITKVDNYGALKIADKDLRVTNFLTQGAISGDKNLIIGTVGNLGGTINLSGLAANDGSTVNVTGDVILTTGLALGNAGTTVNLYKTGTFGTVGAGGGVLNVNAAQNFNGIRGFGTANLNGVSVNTPYVGTSATTWTVDGTGVLNLTGTIASYLNLGTNLNALNATGGQNVYIGNGGYAENVTFTNGTKLTVAAGNTVGLGRLNLSDSSVATLNGTVNVGKDFTLLSGTALNGTGTLTLGDNTTNRINKAGTVFNGTLALGANSKTTFVNSAELNNLTVKDGSLLNLSQSKLKVNGTYTFDGTSSVSLSFTELDAESGLLDAAATTLAGAGALKFDVSVDYSAVVSGRGEIKAVTGKNKGDFTTAGIALPTANNLRYRWDVRDTCSSGGTGVCYDLTVIRTGAQVAQDYNGKDNDVTVAEAVLDKGVFTHDTPETYALAAHIHNLSQKDGVNYVKSLQAMTPDVSGTRTYQANGLQNRVLGTIGSRMTALIPSLQKTPPPVNYRFRGRNGGSPYETRWINRSQYRKAVGYDDESGSAEKSGARKINASDYYRTNAPRDDGDYDAQSGRTTRHVPASDYYDRTYEPVGRNEERAYQVKYDSDAARRYKKKKGRTVKDVNFGLWAETFYAKAKLNGDNGFTGNSTGFAVGFDAGVTDNLVMGLGYSNTSSDTDADQRELTTTNDAFFLYGMYKPSNWYYSGILTYGNSDTDETADFTGGIKRNYTYGGTFIGAQLMAGFDDGSAFSPAAGIRVSSLSTDSYERSGQKVGGFTSTTATLLAEGRYARDYPSEDGDAVFRPEGRLGIGYDVTNKAENANVVLPNGVSYTVKGEELNKLSFELGAKASYNWGNRFEISGGYDGEYRSGYSNHTFSVKARVNF